MSFERLHQTAPGQVEEEAKRERIREKKQQQREQQRLKALNSWVVFFCFFVGGGSWMMLDGWVLWGIYGSVFWVFCCVFNMLDQGKEM